MKGAGRGKRQREAEQAAQEKMTKQLKASAAAVEDLALTKLADMLRQRPRVTAHILRQLEMGCYDFFESDSPDTSAESLPQCVNKFHLLSKDMICKLLGDAVPALKTVIVGNLKVSKAKWVETFTFLLNVDPSSALPTRRIAKLSGWCAERAKRFGGRLPDAKEINDSMKLQDLMGFGYWTLEDEGTLQHVDGETVELPEELRVDLAKRKASVTSRWSRCGVSMCFGGAVVFQLCLGSDVRGLFVASWCWQNLAIGVVCWLN